MIRAAEIQYFESLKLKILHLKFSQEFEKDSPARNFQQQLLQKLVDTKEGLSKAATDQDICYEDDPYKSQKSKLNDYLQAQFNLEFFSKMNRSPFVAFYQIFISSKFFCKLKEAIVNLSMDPPEDETPYNKEFISIKSLESGF